MKINRIVVLFAVIVVFSFVTISQSVTIVRLLNQGIKTNVTVIAVERGDRGRAIATLSFTDQNQITHNVQNVMSDYQRVVGEVVHIIYLPSAPHIVRAATGTANYVMLSWLFIVVVCVKLVVMIRK
jgi:hypothetical protein